MPENQGVLDLERSLYPYFENFVNRTALENMNMICGERSSCGEQMDRF
jgi:hypothetical protein